jgi:hypothetical protein
MIGNLLANVHIHSRGKKIFRKFAKEEGSDSELIDHEDLDAEISAKNLDRPLTRSSVKPRVLFPTAEQVKAKESRSQVTEDEEEAITDIEELGPSTPSDHVARMVTTPKAPKFAHASPPTTARVTRSKNPGMDSLPVKQTSEEDFINSPVRSRSQGSNLSPFDGWKQTKSIGGSKKRAGEPLTKGRASKKTRG